MPSIWKHFSRAKAEPYVFPDASELKVEFPSEPEEPEEETEEVPAAPAEEGPEEEEAPPAPDPAEPINFARLQAEMILQDARRQAAELMEQSRLAAQVEAEGIRERAREEGRREGYGQGVAQGLEEARQSREEQADALEAEVARFLEKAGTALDRQMDQNVDALRDLAVTIAEKVVRVSLKSSGDVIGRMIQAAVDKRKRREWVHIYISECDAKRMAQIPASLSSALSAISDRVRIIPMADDESGTCIIEMPDEIIDASAGTQLNNIRSLLMDTPASGSAWPDLP